MLPEPFVGADGAPKGEHLLGRDGPDTANGGIVVHSRTRPWY